MPSAGDVMTVLGPVPACELGTTTMHEHLLIDLARVSRDPNGRIDEVDLAIEEVGRFAAAGGRTVVDVTNRNLGRDPRALVGIAKATGLNIVMGCGWYREPYYDDEVRTSSTDEVAESIVRDITEGVGPERIRAGIIGEIGCDLDYISPAEERSFRATARAHRRTGLTISTHAYRGTVGLAQLDLLAEEKVEPRRVIVGHCDHLADPDYHEAIARRGAWVQFDLLRETSAWELNKRVRLVCEFVARGYIGQLLLAQDVCKKSHLHAYGGGGYDHMLTRFVPMLTEAGLSDDQLTRLLVLNPQSALTGCAL